MRPSSTATSARRRGAPVPSTTVPLRITRSCSAIVPLLVAPLRRASTSVPGAPAPASDGTRVGAGQSGRSVVEKSSTTRIIIDRNWVISSSLQLAEGVGGDAVGAVAEALVGAAALAGERHDAAPAVVGVGGGGDVAVGGEVAQLAAHERRLGVGGLGEGAGPQGAVLVQGAEDADGGVGEVDAGDLGPEAGGGAAPADATDALQGVVDVAEVVLAGHGGTLANAEKGPLALESSWQ